MRGELAVELADEGDAIGEAKLGAGRCERGVLCRRGAVDDEARARQRLEYGAEGGIAHPVVRPGEPGTQRQRRGGVECQQTIEAGAKLAARVGRGAAVEAECKAAAVDIGLA